MAFSPSSAHGQPDAILRGAVFAKPAFPVRISIELKIALPSFQNGRLRSLHGYLEQLDGGG